MKIAVILFNLGGPDKPDNDPSIITTGSMLEKAKNIKIKNISILPTSPTIVGSKIYKVK